MVHVTDSEREPMMDLHTFSLSLATFLLVAVAGVSGMALIDRRNYLLGDLWLLLAFSGCCFLFHGVYRAPATYDIAQLCDAFFKGMGGPLLATAGLMAVTHQYRPSRFASALILCAAVAVATQLEVDERLDTLRMVLRVATWSAFSIFLWYLAGRLAKVGEHRHALGVLLAMLTAQAIAVLAGVHLVLEGLAASYLCIELFYAYCALERATARQTASANTSIMT